MKIAFGSDLHIEFGARTFEFPEADVLLLAGDVLVVNDLTLIDDSESGQSFNARQFLREASAAYKTVLWVPGNHEFYHGNLDKSVEVVNNFLRSEGIKNIAFNHAGVFDIEDVRFVVATLWTDLNKGNPLTMNSAMCNMNDYNRITRVDPTLVSGGRYLTATDTVNIHSEHREYIRKSVQNHDNVVVMTHHAPNSLSSDNWSRTSGNQYAYICTDMDDLILDNPQIKLWIHGHLHTRKEYQLGSTTVVSNCRGYIGHEYDADSFFLQTLYV